MILRRPLQHIFLLVFIFSITILISGCGGAAPVEGIFVWIDVPVDGLTVPVGEPISIEGHATNTGGVAQIDIWLDSALLFTIPNPPADGELARFSESWIPPGAGEYTIQ